MNTLNGKVLPMYERVTHVAFGCACVRTFYSGQDAEAIDRCAIHGDRILSTTEELVRKQAAA